MKKSLLMALTLSLGIAGTAFAANPFTDVPSNHWAYASVAKLAQAGIVEGYGDDTFRGGRNITRYEMAQMVAKAMAKVDQADASQKAMIEKLAAEFSAELENLGVRVAKLEKNSDNVKITGEMRLRYRTFKGDMYDGKTSDGSTYNETKLRTRLNISGEINDNWKANMMLENTQDLQTNGRDSEDDTKMRRAWVQGKMGETTVKAGRFPYSDVNSFLFDAAEIDGASVEFGKELKTTLMYGRMTGLSTGAFAPGASKDVDTLALALDYQKDKWQVNTAYYNLNGRNDAPVKGETGSSTYFGQLYLGYKFDKNFELSGQYLYAGTDVNNSGKSGYTARLDYKGMNLKQKGSWGAYVLGYSAPAGVLYSPFGLDIDLKNAQGLQGFEVGADYAILKNTRLHVAYNDSKEKSGSGTDGKRKDQKTATMFLRFYF